MRAALAWLGVVMAGCATDLPSKTGAAFRTVAPEAPSAPVEAMYTVCWPQDASASQRVVLTWLADDVVFEAREGASNATGRCLREIATSYPFSTRPTGSVELAPPAQPLDGWAVLGWVKLLSSSRYGPERGLIDAAPAVRACLNAGAGRTTARFAVRHVPGPQVRVFPEAVSEVDRCLEAVVGSIVWPSSREVFFEFPPTPRAVASSTAPVAMYFAPPTPSTGTALDPASVKDAIHLALPKVSACWDLALARRANFGGARTFRFRVAGDGTVQAAWVASGLERGPVAADYLFDQCLHGALLSVHFPPEAGEGVYTWVFATRG
jgi:hypothetical protein